MANLNYLKASAGAGNAVLAHVQSNRTIGATVLDVDSVANWPAEFIATVGTLLGTNYLNPATVTEFRGHTLAGDIIIDGYEPGYTDIGNTINQVVIIKQTTGWADSVVNTMRSFLNDNGTFKQIAAVNGIALTGKIAGPDTTTPITPWENRVISGGVWTQVSGLNGTMTILKAWINNKPVNVAAIATRAFTASKDTYIDVKDDGTVIYVEVANGATTGMTLTLNSDGTPALRLGMVPSAGAALTAASIKQYQTDPLGNLMYNQAAGGGLPIRMNGNSGVIGRTSMGGAMNSGTFADLGGTPAQVYVPKSGMSVLCIGTVGMQSQVGGTVDLFARVIMDGNPSSLGAVAKFTSVIQYNGGTAGVVDLFENVSAGWHTFKLQARGASMDAGSSANGTNVFFIPIGG